MIRLPQLAAAIFTTVLITLGSSAGAQRNAESLESSGPFPAAHAHNDYEHERPLVDALAWGFCSVEADVFPVEGDLLVAHHAFDIQPGRTLRRLYLEPLLARLKEHGRVQPEANTFTLLVDIKAGGEAAYALLKEQLDGLDSKYPNYNDVLDNIASIAQEIAYLQVLDASKVDVQDEIIELSNNHSPELIQLIYQIAINSKKDLSLAPSAREGFTMAILRMFAFQLSDEQSVENKEPSTTQKKIKKSEPLANGNSETSIISSKNWTNEVSKMSIRGAVKQLASNCFFDRIDNHILYLKIHSQNEHQMIDRAVDDLNSFLINEYEEVNKVIIQIEEENGKTLAGEEKIKNEEQIIMNESRASSDPLVQEYVDLFDATIEETK